MNGQECNGDIRTNSDYFGLNKEEEKGIRSDGDNSQYFAVKKEDEGDSSMGTVVVSSNKHSENEREPNGDSPLSLLIFTSDAEKEQSQWGHLHFLALLAVKFISEHCKKGANQIIYADVLRDALSKESGHVVNSRQLGRVLKSMGLARVRRRRRIQRYYAYLGLTFKPDSPYAPKEITEKENGDTRKTSVSTRNGEIKNPNGDVHNLCSDVHTQENSEPNNGDTYNLRMDTYTPEKPEEPEIGYYELDPD